jgi:hypothetical protein
LLGLLTLLLRWLERIRLLLLLRLLPRLLLALRLPLQRLLLRFSLTPVDEILAHDAVVSAGFPDAAAPELLRPVRITSGDALIFQPGLLRLRLLLWITLPLPLPTPAGLRLYALRKRSRLAVVLTSWDGLALGIHRDWASRITWHRGHCHEGCLLIVGSTSVSSLGISKALSRPL